MKRILRILFAPALVFLAGCSFNNPVLPSWFVDLYLPIPTSEFVLEDAINDSTLTTDTTGTGIPILVVEIEDSLQRTNITSNDLGFAVESSNFGKSIGEITVDSPGSQQTAPISAADIVGFTLVSGVTVDIPATTVNPPSRSVVFGNYNYVVINSGTLTLTFNNGTFLNIASGMTISIIDDSLNTAIGTSTFSQRVPANSSASAEPVDLSGKLISRKIRLEFSMPIEAEAGHLITDNDVASSANVDVSMTELSVSEASAQIPSQSITLSDSLSFTNSGDQIRRAVIDRGTVGLEVANDLPVNALIHVTLPNFKELSGTVFQRDFNMQANSVQVEHFDLAGLELNSYPQAGVIIDNLHYDVEVISEATSGRVNIHNTDSVNVHVVPDSIFLQEFDGMLEARVLDLEPVTQSDLFDYSGFDGNLRLNDLVMTINVHNEIGLPIDLTLNISGAHFENGATVPSRTLALLPITKTIAAGSPGNPALTVIELTAADPSPNIIDLMAILPTDISVDGQADVGGDGSFTVNDGVWADYAISSPLAVRLTGASMYTSEVQTITEDQLEKDVRSIFEGRFGRSALHLDVANAMPFGADIRIHISTDSTNLYDADITDSTRKVILDVINFPAGVIGSSGYVESPSEESIDISLRGKQINIFQFAPLYVGLKVQARDTDGFVRVRSTDRFSANGYILLNYRVNEDN